MTQQREQSDEASRTGLSGEANLPLSAGKLWIGKHSVDEDLLVFDPSEADPASDPLPFYSLSQHRKRVFPRSVVQQKIQPLSDDVGIARAQRDYARRNELQAAHEEELETSRAERTERQRSGILSAHLRYLQTLGITDVPDGGATTTPADFRPGRATRCHSCGVALDNFADAVCTVCSGVVCSCGACACGSPSKRKPVRSAESTQSPKG